MRSSWEDVCIAVNSWTQHQVEIDFILIEENCLTETIHPLKNANLGSMLVILIVEQVFSVSWKTLPRTWPLRSYRKLLMLIVDRFGHVARHALLHVTVFKLSCYVLSFAVEQVQCKGNGAPPTPSSIKRLLWLEILCTKHQTPISNACQHLFELGSYRWYW